MTKVKFIHDIGLWSIYRLWLGFKMYSPSNITYVTDNSYDIVFSWVCGHPSYLPDEFEQVLSNKIRAYYVESLNTDYLEWIRPTDILFTYDIKLKELLHDTYNIHLMFHGFDDTHFTISNRSKRIYTIATTGWNNYDRVSQINHCVASNGGYHLALGMTIPVIKEQCDNNINLNYIKLCYYHPSTDTSKLAQVLNKCWYVSGITEVRGIERLICEGLACGAKPIVFDRDMLRYWFYDCVEYVSEDKCLFEKQLTTLLQQKPKISKKHINFIKHNYSFKVIVPSVYSIIKKY